ncbi:MAG: hypothetical protein U1A24_07920 [Cypionkella sp.]|nr:hypothetical protein [Cypionkella sp.]MDZ4310470.1 hypothetical protein [Cypionkella sp.]MDZ4391749.1 hypothetical protein [Cypionkella sp.]
MADPYCTRLAVLCPMTSRQASAVLTRAAEVPTKPVNMEDDQ